MKKSLIVLASVFVAVQLTQSCSIASKRVEKAVEKARERNIKELNNQITGEVNPAYIANWDKAVTDLFWKNPQIINAEFQIADSISTRMGIWRQFIPTLSASFSDTATFGEIATLFEDTSLRVSSFFSFGSLLDMPKRLIAARISQFGTEWSAELTMRNEVIGLYRIFREKELLDLEARAIQAERDLIEEITINKNSSDYFEKIDSSKDKLENFKKKQVAWRDRFSELHMQHYSKVSLDARSVPEIRYRPEDLNFEDSARWGVLLMNLQSLEIMAEDASLSSTLRRYYPIPSLSVSVPALYSSTSANNDFRFEDFTLRAGLSWNIDTKNDIWRQIQRIKRSKPQRVWAIDKRRSSEIAKLLEGREALRVVQEEIEETRTLIQEYRELVNSGLVTNLEGALTRMRGFKEREITLLAKEIDICSSFWLIDESRWEETTKKWKKILVEKESQRPKPWYKKIGNAIHPKKIIKREVL